MCRRAGHPSLQHLPIGIVKLAKFDMAVCRRKGGTYRDAYSLFRVKDRGANQPRIASTSSCRIGYGRADRHNRDAGQRSATITFNVGQGSRDRGGAVQP